jgi:hypothetical protein
LPSNSSSSPSALRLPAGKNNANSNGDFIARTNTCGQHAPSSNLAKSNDSFWIRAYCGLDMSLGIRACSPNSTCIWDAARLSGVLRFRRDRREAVFPFASIMLQCVSLKQGTKCLNSTTRCKAIDNTPCTSGYICDTRAADKFGGLHTQQLSKAETSSHSSRMHAKKRELVSYCRHCSTPTHASR